MTTERRIDFRVPDRLLQAAGFCRACRAPIVFWSLTAGKTPLDVASAIRDPEASGFSRLESHFAHCPSAQRFRRTRRERTSASEEIAETYGRARP